MLPFPMSLTLILRPPSPPPILCAPKDLLVESPLRRRPTEHPARMRVLSGVPDSSVRSRRISTENRLTEHPTRMRVLSESVPQDESKDLSSPLTPLDSALTDSCARKSFRIRSYEKTWGAPPVPIKQRKTIEDQHESQNR